MEHNGWLGWPLASIKEAKSVPRKSAHACVAFSSLFSWVLCIFADDPPQSLVPKSPNCASLHAHVLKITAFFNTPHSYRGSASDSAVVEIVAREVARVFTIGIVTRCTRRRLGLAEGVTNFNLTQSAFRFFLHVDMVASHTRYR